MNNLLIPPHTHKSLFVALLLGLSVVFVPSCMMEEIAPEEPVVFEEEQDQPVLAQDPDWEAFRVLDAESLISFDFESSDEGSRKEGLRTFAGKVDTEGALMTRGSFGDIFSFPIIPHRKDRESLWNLVLTIDQEGNRNWHVREYRGNISDQSVTSMQDFTGSLFIYDMQGALQLEFEAQEGILKKARGSASNKRMGPIVDDQGCKYSIYTHEVCIVLKTQGAGPLDPRQLRCTTNYFIISEGCDSSDLNSGTDSGGTGYNDFYTPADQGVPIGQPAPSAEVAEALNIHQGLVSRFPQLGNEVIDVEGIVEAHGLDTYKATATLYEAYAQEVGQSPSDPYQWQLMMEEFGQNLGPLLLELIPGGIGDLIGAYHDFRDGNYFMGALGIVLAAVPGTEVVKVIRKADNFKVAFKGVYKIIVVWNKLASLPGGQRVFAKMPKAWKDLPGSKLANNQNGLYWQMSSNFHFRIMDANLSSLHASQRVPYAKFHKGNGFLDVNGNKVAGNTEAAHIPLSDITNEFLENFFKNN